MIDPIELTAVTMARDTQTINQISQNVANVNTQGYRAKSAQANFTLSLDNNALSLSQVSPEKQGGIVEADGALNQTGKALDFALLGKGFFVIKQNEDYLLTRSGRFVTDQEGYIRTQTGGWLMGKTGPIQIEVGNLELTADGELYLNGNFLDELNIAVPVTGSKMEHKGAGHYFVKQVQQAESNAYQLHQGYLEASNVDVAGEMINLLSTQRHFGLMQRYMATYDGMVKDAINNLGK